MESHMRKGLFAGAAALILAIVAFRFGSTSDQSKPKDSTPKNPEAGATKNRNGERRVETTYKTPAGEDAVAFQLLVDGSGTIARADTEVKAQNDISKKFQEAFSKDISSVLVGKRLSELSAIDTVGGASLTTKAFNDALGQLKS